MLTYGPSQGGYVVDLTREQIQGAPSYTSGAMPDWTDQAYGRWVNDDYKAGSGV